MKLKILPPVLFIILAANMTSGFSQNSERVDEFMPGDLVSEGVALGKKKKFEEAHQKFESALVYWQVSVAAQLFLTIIDDFKNGTIKKSIAGDIFKAAQENLNARYEKAAKKFKKIVQKQGDYFPAHVLYADVLANLDKGEEATLHFNNAVSLAEQEPLPYLLRGKYFAKTNEMTHALADFTTAIKLNAVNPVARFERGFAYCAARKYDAAIKDFESLGDKYPDWRKSSVVLEAFYNRGVQRMGKKSYRSALKDFNKAIEIEPNYANSYFSRGLAYRSLKKYSQSIAEFTICIEKKPDYDEAFFQRASTHFKRKHYKKAIADLKKALELRPGNAKYEYKLAESYYKQTDYKNAIVYFDKVLKKSPTNYWANYWKGYSYKYLGRASEAVTEFEQFLKLAPRNHRSQRAYAEDEIQALR